MTDLKGLHTTILPSRAQMRVGIIRTVEGWGVRHTRALHEYVTPSLSRSFARVRPDIYSLSAVLRPNAVYTTPEKKEARQKDG